MRNATTELADLKDIVKIADPEFGFYLSEEFYCNNETETYVEVIYSFMAMDLDGNENPLTTVEVFHYIGKELILEYLPDAIIQEYVGIELGL